MHCAAAQMQIIPAVPMLPTIILQSSKLNLIATECCLSFLALSYFAATNSTTKIATSLLATVVWIN